MLKVAKKNLKIVRENRCTEHAHWVKSTKKQQQTHDYSIFFLKEKFLEQCSNQFWSRIELNSFKGKL